ncbi:MAG: MarR family transcriptional regulator [Gemmatimonadota bacterium]
MIHGVAGEPDPELMEVLNAFRRLLRALRVAAGETQSRYQVSPAQLFVLEELNAAGRPLSITELANLSMTDRSSVADVVERLVQAEYATRERSADDRRRAEVRITPAGAALARSAPPAPGLQLLNGLKALSEAELKSLSLGMTRLLAEMGLVHGQAGFMFEDDKKEIPPDQASRHSSS